MYQDERSRVLWNKEKSYFNWVGIEHQSAHPLRTFRQAIMFQNY